MLWSILMYMALISFKFIDLIRLIFSVQADFFLMSNDVVTVEHKDCKHIDWHLLSLRLIGSSKTRPIVGTYLGISIFEAFINLSRRSLSFVFILILDRFPYPFEIVDFTLEMKEGSIIYIFTAEVTFNLFNEQSVDQLVLEIVYPDGLYVEELHHHVSYVWYQTLMLLPGLDEHMLLLTVVFLLVFWVIAHEDDLHEVPEVDILIPSSYIAHPVEEIVALDLSVADWLDKNPLL